MLSFKKFISENNDSSIRMGFHVTPTKNIRSIMKNGLIPKIGSRSKDFGETDNSLFLFKTTDDAEQAVMNWLGDYFDEDESLSLLQIILPDDVQIGKGADFEIVLLSPVPPTNISIKQKNI